jgi:2-amino-4-hydroxy-6-hydroxymethyldihydropteridine diphosphokinase
MNRELILLIGSNIQPEKNIARALDLLRRQFTINRQSSIWETEPYHSLGDNFLNLAISIKTDMSRENLRSLLRKIEADLERVRTEDKFAPRTMDIDIILDGELVVDEKLWKFGFVAVPVSQLEPNLVSPTTRLTLQQIARKLIKKSRIVEYPAHIE